MEEDCCIDDALLADVVAKAKVARKSIHSTYHDPEEAWIDAYLEGWFAGHFNRTPRSEPITEPTPVVN